MVAELLPDDIRERYQIQEWRHAIAIIKSDFPGVWDDLMAVLRGFQLELRFLTKAGGNKSALADELDRAFFARGWQHEVLFDTTIRTTQITTMANGPARERTSPTHKVDCFKDRIALELEWNNKDPFFDRDLNNFRLLFDLDVISAGIIITRSHALQEILKRHGMKKFGASTTHWDKLIPRMEGGSGGGCPVLAIGITDSLYRGNIDADIAHAITRGTIKPEEDSGGPGDNSVSDIDDFD